MTFALNLLAAAVAGCDVRQSQVDLTRRRLRTVTPTLLAEVQVKEVGAA